MSHHSDKPSMCRVDFWKESGKWYMTEAIDFGGFYDEPFPHDAFKKALWRQMKGRAQGMRATCLDPYVANPFPISVIVPDSEPQP